MNADQVTVATLAINKGLIEARQALAEAERSAAYQIADINSQCTHITSQNDSGFLPSNESDEFNRPSHWYCYGCGKVAV